MPEVLGACTGRFSVSVQWLQKPAEDHASSIPLICSVLQGCFCALRLGTKLTVLEKHLQQHLSCTELKSVPFPTWSMVQDPGVPCCL